MRFLARNRVTTTDVINVLISPRIRRRGSSCSSIAYVEIDVTFLHRHTLIRDVMSLSNSDCALKHKSAAWSVRTAPPDSDVTHRAPACLLITASLSAAFRQRLTS